MICIMQDAEYRLRFKYKLSKFELLEVCRIPEHDGYDDTNAKELGQRIRAVSDNCEGCVDPHFSKV